MALTKQQKQVLDFIAGFLEKNGYCPSYEEIGRGLQLASLATVHKHISVLEQKSYLKRGSIRAGRWNWRRSIFRNSGIFRSSGAAGRERWKFRCWATLRPGRRWNP